MDDQADKEAPCCGARVPAETATEQAPGCECGTSSAADAARCCSPAPGDAGCCAHGAGRSGRLRRLLSLSVVAATVILLAHAITKDRQPVPTANAGVPGALAREGKPAGKWESAQWPPADRGSGQAGSAGKSASAGSGATSDLMASLGAAAADNEAVFVLLPGEDRSRTEAARRAVNTAVAKVRARGRRAAALRPAAPPAETRPRPACR